MSAACFRALDYEFVVEAPRPLADVLATALEPLSVPHDELEGAPEPIVVREDGDERWITTTGGIDSRPASRGRTLALLLEFINRSAAQSLRAELPLHAAAVQHPDGGVVALVGASGAGKSTLGAAAVASGWRLVAEEIAAVDPTDWRVRPFHRRIGLRQGGAAALGVDYPSDGWYDEVYPRPVPFGQRSFGDVVIGAAIVRRDAHDRVDELSPALALVGLVEHTVVPEGDRIAPVFRVLDELVRRIPVVRLAFSGLDEGVAALDRLARGWQS